MAFRVDILCIAEDRIFQDSVCKIQTAVCVCTAAETFAHTLLFPIIQIRFPVIQFYIGIHFCSSFLIDHDHSPSALRFLLLFLVLHLVQTDDAAV